MASRDNHLLKSYIQSRESLNICVIMTNNKWIKNNYPITPSYTIQLLRSTKENAI